MSSNTLPRQDIPTKDKTPAWMSKHLDYSENILRNYNDTRHRMTRMFNGYNGIKNPASIEWLTKTYGQENKAQYIAYRLGKTKIDLLQGEYLKRPLMSTVTTVNARAVSDKMEQYYFLKGAMEARDEIAAVKDIAGVDVMEGMPIPENQTVFEKMNFKNKYEDVAQIIINQQTKQLDIKKKTADAFLNCVITNRANMMVELNEKGEVKLHNIDPRDAIYEVIDNDSYHDQSPIRGARKIMSVHQVLLRYELTKDQRDLLDTARLNPQTYTGANGLGRGYMSYNNGELMCDVIHIEWDSVEPLYYKKVKKTASQLMIDPSEDTITLEMNAQKYEANKEFHDKNVAKGEYEIVTKYITQLYEATRIGGIIDINMRPVQGKKRSIDDPSTILSSTYINYTHGMVNGTTVSLQQIMENYENLYDLVQYQKNKELAKMKGRILTIDKAGLGVNQKLTDVYYRMANDQALEYDSSAAGNMGTRNLDPRSMFQQFDLGLTESFQQLLMVENNIISNINQITGINENRMGQTAASSTATAQQSDIANSRTITEALFYGFSGFVQRVMKAVLDKSIISYAFYKTDEGEAVLGTEKYGFLKATVDIAYQDYALEIEDGSRYMQISQDVKQMMEFSLNAKEIRPIDALNVLLAETVAEKVATLEKSWEDMQATIQKSNEQQQQMDAQMQQQQLATQIQIAQENREDNQKQEIDSIVLKGQVQMQVDDNKAQKDAILLNQKINGDIITKTEPPL
jgi:hypothetical protein